MTLGLVGCNNSGERIRSYQLERSFALANSYWDANSFDVTSEGANAFLIDGWSFAETNRAGESFRWSNARSSRFGFMVFEPRDATLVVRGLAFPAEESDNLGPLTVTVAAGQQEVGSFQLGSGFTEHALPISRDQLITGRNDFELRYSWIRSDLASQTERRWNRSQRNLAAAWTSIALVGTDEVHQPAADVPPNTTVDLVAGTLSMATGSWIEYELELAPGSVIEVESIRCDGCGTDSPRVDIFLGGLERTEITPAGSLTGEQESIELLPAQPDLPLAQRISGPTRTLVLRAPRAPNPSTTAGHITLTSPMILRPRPEL